jgi:hypothetical protein
MLPRHSNGLIVSAKSDADTRDVADALSVVSARSVPINVVWKKPP